MSKGQYRNPYYNKHYQGSRPFYDVDPNKEVYRGYEIHRYSSVQFHSVKDGVCVGMNAGINGAKQHIDSLINKKHE